MATAKSQFRASTPQIYLDIDRSKVASLGVSLDDVNQTLDMYLVSLYVNSYNAFGRHWQVTVQADDVFRDRVQDIRLLAVRNNQNQMVTLGTLTAAPLIGGPISITRDNLYEAAAVTGQRESRLQRRRRHPRHRRHRRRQASHHHESRLDRTDVPAGQRGQQRHVRFRPGGDLRFSGAFALYESWALPAAVILVVPLCLLCSVAGVLITGRDVNIFVQIGLVVLVALACKNAILIVEFGKQLMMQGRPRYEATQESSRLRLRPIMMTSFAFIFGVLPLALATGAGAEMRRSLGIAVFYGMLGVTMFGIFLTPVFFYVIQGLGQSPVFLSERGKAAVSFSTGAGSGFASGYLLALLKASSTPWGPIIVAVTGIVLMWAVRELGRQIGPLGNGRRSEAGDQRSENRDQGSEGQNPTSDLRPPTSGIPPAQGGDNP